MQRMPSAMASVTGMLSQLRTSSFCRRMARGPDSTIAATHSSTASSRAPGATTFSTSPQASAVAASIVSPV
jgi:hypothetical protein